MSKQIYLRVEPKYKLFVGQSSLGKYSEKCFRIEQLILKWVLQSFIEINEWELFCIHLLYHQKIVAYIWLIQKNKHHAFGETIERLQAISLTNLT